MKSTTLMDEKPLQGGTCSEAAETSPSLLSIYFLWPVFLACSWTWVIGMYLPVLLRDRYGWLGVLAFAVPNVLGIMLFGWGIRNINQSRAFLHKHHSAALWFSAVTVAFHAWFFGWFWSAELGFHPAYSILIGLAFLTFTVITAGLSDRVFLWISAAVYAVSLLLLVITLVSGWSFLSGSEPSPRTLYWPSAASGAWVYLVPIMFMGFLTCPYLDLTFHRAYQSVGGGTNGRTIFVLFGLFFAVMITFTAVYSITGFTWFIIIHLLVQGWLTTTLHVREIVTHTKFTSEGVLAKRVIRLSYILLFIAPLPLIDYRDWFLFYGIIFPSIFLLRTVRSMRQRAEAGTLSIWVVVLFSIPFAVAGFLAGHEWALVVPPLVVVFMSLWGGRALRGG